MDDSRHRLKRRAGGSRSRWPVRWRRCADDFSAPPIEVIRPTTAQHGDFSTNLALKLAGPLRRPPRQIADDLVARVLQNGADLIQRAEVAGAGFVNVWLNASVIEDGVDAVRAGRHRTSVIWRPSPKHNVNVEFVSANPTGPLHVGNARGAFVGDC